MACQPDTGKVKRIATMLHKGATITRTYAAFYQAWLYSSETTRRAELVLGCAQRSPKAQSTTVYFRGDERGGLRNR
jgi:hypothetical protein